MNEPYGLTYEMVDKKLKLVPPRTLQEVGRMFVNTCPCRCLFFISEDTDATNELINDGQMVQPLTREEIQVLQQSGIHASVWTNLGLEPICFLIMQTWQEIIKAQIEAHANYALKTEYSKEKYKKRKEAKCVQCIYRVYELNSHQILEDIYYYRAHALQRLRILVCKRSGSDTGRPHRYALADA